MKKILLSILCFTLISHHIMAMGSKSTPLQETDTHPSASKIELGRKLAHLQLSMSMPQNMFSKIVKPLQDELKRSWNVDDAFMNTVSSIDQQNEAMVKPFITAIEDLFAKAYAGKYSEEELKELVSIYEKPVMQKQGELIWSWFAEEIIRAIKDPQIWQAYSQQVAGIFTALLITGMQKATIANQFLTSFSTEIVKAMDQAKLDLNTEEGRKIFREKFAQTYPSIAGFADTAAQKLSEGKSIANAIGNKTN